MVFMYTRIWSSTSTGRDERASWSVSDGVIAEPEGEATNLDTQVAERLYICIYFSLYVYMSVTVSYGHLACAFEIVSVSIPIFLVKNWKTILAGGDSNALTCIKYPLRYCLCFLTMARAWNQRCMVADNRLHHPTHFKTLAHLYQ